MKTYYCEIEGHESQPHFPGYKVEAENPTDAIKKFQALHTKRLEIVYDEDFQIIWALEDKL